MKKLPILLSAGLLVLFSQGFCGPCCKKGEGDKSGPQCLKHKGQGEESSHGKKCDHAKNTLNIICPITGEPASKDVHYDFEGNGKYEARRVYFCCAHCIESFKEDPSRYLDEAKNSEGATAEETAVAAAVQEYEVFGMDCPGCHGGLCKLVEKIPGVASSKASWKEKRLWITLKQGAQVDEKAVLQAIGDANFTAGKRLQ